MAELRWLLIIIGVVIILAVYAYSRYQSHSKNEKESPRSSPPSNPLVSDKKIKATAIPSLRNDYSKIKFDGELLGKTKLSEPNKHSKPEETKPLEIEQPLEKPPERTATTLVILHVWAHSGQYWQGDQLMEVAEQAGLTATDTNIFQYFHQSNSTVPLFHVANKTEPGTFEWDKMKQFKTQGVSLFIKLPTFFSAYEAFSLMYACAQRFANALKGEIRTENHKPITQKSIDDIYRLCRTIDEQHNSV